VRYRLHDRSNLLKLLKNLDGNIRNSTRLLQYNRLSHHYDININININPLTYNSNWMAGFFDADGSITINNNTYQLSISISQKTQELLLPCINLYGGQVYIDRSSNTYN
jgi:DNA-binding transcriptional regulator WhiA